VDKQRLPTKARKREVDTSALSMGQWVRAHVVNNFTTGPSYLPRGMRNMVSALKKEIPAVGLNINVLEQRL